MSSLDRAVRRALNQAWAADPRLDIRAPRCPLCHHMMTRESRPAHRCYVFACHRPGCQIVVRVDDPFVGKWESTSEKVPGLECPNMRCSGFQTSKMRFFATRTGYMKAVCALCNASIATSETPMKHNRTYAPDDLGIAQGGAAKTEPDDPVKEDSK